jgi:hypothetical protein
LKILTDGARIGLCSSRYFNSHSINGSSELFEDPIFNNELKSHVLFIYISKQRSNDSVVIDVKLSIESRFTTLIERRSKPLDTKTDPRTRLDGPASQIPMMKTKKQRTNVHALEFLKYILIVLLIFHGKFK